MGNSCDLAVPARPQMAARRTPTPVEYAIAAHEAGHCAIGHYLGYRILSARIHPEGIDGERGSFLFDDGDRTDGDAWHFERLEDQACVFLAGGVAHMRVPDHGLGWADCQVDLARVEVLANGAREFYRLARRTDRLVTKLWPWIEALAAQLLVSRFMEACQVVAVLSGCPVQPVFRGRRICRQSG